MTYQKETKTETRARLQAIADRLGVPFNSLFREVTEKEIKWQEEQWEALRKRIGKHPRRSLADILKSIPGRDRPPLPGDEWPPLKASSRRSAPKLRRAAPKRRRATPAKGTRRAAA